MNYLKLHLTHWGWVTHICVSKLTVIGSDNGLSPGWRQAIICTNDGLLLIGALGTNFSEILIKIQTFSFWKYLLKVSSAKWRSFCLGLNELNLSRANKLIFQMLSFLFHTILHVPQSRIFIMVSTPEYFIGPSITPLANYLVANSQ